MKTYKLGKNQSGLLYAGNTMQVYDQIATDSGGAFVNPTIIKFLTLKSLDDMITSLQTLRKKLVKRKVRKLMTEL